MEIFEIFMLSFITVGLVNLAALAGAFFAITPIAMDITLTSSFLMIIVSIDVIIFFGFWMLMTHDWLPYEFKQQHPYLCLTIFIVAASVIILCWIVYITWKIIKKFKKSNNKKVT